MLPLPDRIRAVVFDVDGTLYRQPPLRACMAGELAAAALRSPRGAARTARVLAEFRRVREELRGIEPAGESLEAVSFGIAGDRLGVPPAEVARLVEEWMQRRPLKYLRACRRPGLPRLLATAAARRVALGVLSDYPAAAKLHALALPDVFSVVLCTTDPDINAFKPHPRGFLRACERLGIPPEEVLYVGDRPETDAAGANAAGISCVLVGRRRRGPEAHGRRLASIGRHLARC